MTKWQRALYHPVLPLGPEGRRITASPEHIELSRQAATEGMVLLKNKDHILPLKKGSRVALFGKATADYVKGGGGSGDVTVSYTRNLYEGMQMKEREGKVSINHALADFYVSEVKKQHKAGVLPGFTVEPEVPDELFTQAKASCDTAIISICRFSGEGWDRQTVLDKDTKYMHPSLIAQLEMNKKVFQNGDYYLTNEEAALVEKVKANFDRVIVVLNIGGVCDTTWFKDVDEISGVLLSYQAGMEGGLATADLLVGDANPSAKLTDTFASALEDYPSTATFHESLDYVDYTDDIYVGYRYFETIPGAAKKVNYPFGFGLSYTEFKVRPVSAEKVNETIRFTVDVKNIGNVAGKEVVQLYYSAPDGVLGKPAKVLGAYKKTRLLSPGETQTIVLTLAIADMASYDDLGRIAKSAYILEKGVYHFYIGTSVRDLCKPSFTYKITKDMITKQLSSKAAPSQLAKRMTSDGTFEALPVLDKDFPVSVLTPLEETEGILPAIRGKEHTNRADDFDKKLPQLIDVAKGRMTLDEFVDALPTDALIHLLGGQPNIGVANTFGIGNLPEYGIPGIMTADGPAGLRIQPECGVCTTAWPCATMMAATWNTKLVEQVGAAAALEVKENNIGVWLTPAMNIHRSPLCGRNFEYYSEDPLVAGKTGAAMTRGIQSQHIGVSVKHFCCNNKETNRKNSDSRVSERALREIYLKGFEIVVKEADPYTIMSSYNLINGCRASENQDLLTGILREEWGFKGIVTTDWWTCGEHYLETKAGNDLKMGTGFPERVQMALTMGEISREEIALCAKRILEMILKID